MKEDEDKFSHLQLGFYRKQVVTEYVEPRSHRETQSHERRKTCGG